MQTTTANQTIIESAQTIGKRVFDAFRVCCNRALGDESVQVPQLIGDDATFATQYLLRNVPGDVATYVGRQLGLSMPIATGERSTGESVELTPVIVAHLIGWQYDVTNELAWYEHGFRGRR